MTSGADMIGTLAGRIGRRTFGTPEDVAAALDVSPQRVRAWIRAGEIEAFNAGTARRPAFKVFMPSLLAFIVKRSTRRTNRGEL